jgi:hypothetical protein
MRIRVWRVAAAAILVYGLSPRSVVAAPFGISPVNAGLPEPVTSVTAPQPDTVSPLGPVRVRVYRSTAIRGDALRLALRVAETTFAAADVQVVWTVCEPSECSAPPAPTERLVRLVRLPRGQHGDLRCLGDAFIDPRQSGNALATVYADQVADVARRGNIDYGALLGHTIAHEIGHLLLGSTTHGASGLMREIWSQKEMRSHRGDDWALLPVEAASIRQRLTTLQRSA